jgi:hypothetical protein
MKKIIYTSLFVGSVLALLSWTATCGFPIYSKQGAKLEYSLTSMGELSSSKVLVKEVLTTNGETKSTLEMSNFDAKGKSIGSSLSTITCKDGVMKFDMKSMMEKVFETLKSQNMEANVTSITPIEYKLTMVVGEVLKDATIVLETAMNGQKIMKMTNTITNRKVVSKENITVKAGNFLVYKITEELVIDTQLLMMGNKINQNKMSQITYVSPEVGNVKTVMYDQKGKEMTTQELVSYTK